MIYLSWSIIMLLGYLLLGAAATAWYWKEKKVTTKQAVAVLSVYTLVILFLAFDVGTRQQDLQRSSFDATVPTESVDKVERKTLDRNDVKENFENTVKEIE